MSTAQFSVTQTILNPDNPTNLTRSPQPLKMEEGQRLRLDYEGKSFYVNLKKAEYNRVLLFTDTLLVNRTNNTGNVILKPEEFEIKLKDSAILATPAMGKGSLWELRLEGVLTSESQPNSPAIPNQSTPEIPTAQPLPPVPSKSEPTPLPEIKKPPYAPNPTPPPALSNQPLKPTAPPTPSGYQIKIRIPKINWKQTQEILAKVEERLGDKVVTYYTSPAYEISDVHTEIFIDHLNRHTPAQESLNLVLISNGGSPTAALRISALFREYFKSVFILVPTRCASAATMISLSGDKIYFSPSGFLTAIDLSSTYPLNPKAANGLPVSISVDQIKRILKFLNDEGPARTQEQIEGSYRTLFKYLSPLAVGHIDRVSSLSELVATKVMKMHSQSFASEEKIKTIASHLVNNYPSHGFPILYSEAKEIGLPAEKMDREIADLLWDLVKLYDSTSIPTRTHKSQDLYHHEEFPVIIESKEMRTMGRISMDKRLNPVTRSWGTENNNTNWINLKPSDTPGREFEISTLDVIEKNSDSQRSSSP